MPLSYKSRNFAVEMKAYTILYVMMLSLPCVAQNDSTALPDQTLTEVTVSSRKATTRRMAGAMNATEMMRGELFKAACCNLGESFVNNPSVDVNYSDAATGARQIRLLGLAGTYVQMLTENLPDFRGAAMPYALGYVPGSWMKSIQVSKGNSSVKNGYEAMTGQINIEYVKPEDPEGATVNLYGNTMGRWEANFDANIDLLSDKRKRQTTHDQLSTALLGHYERAWRRHDGNGDGFQDDPDVWQWNLQNRWFYRTGIYMLHAGVALIKERRHSGQTHAVTEPWRSRIETDRYQAYMKHAFIVDEHNGGNLALMATATLHQQDAAYGLKTYDVNEKNAYASLMYETSIAHDHNISAGLSLNYDRLRQHYNLTGLQLPDSRVLGVESETTPGAYAQYTYNSHGGKLTAMAGFRVDHSNRYGTFATPRFHVRWAPADLLTVRLSAGKGYRTPHALAEHNYLMASGRRLVIDRLEQEAAWNYGVSTQWNFYVGRKLLKLNLEYYYTDFLRQTVIDYDSDPAVLHIANLDGDSYSHTLQADVAFTPLRGLDLTAAYRYNLVRETLGGRLMSKPLQSRYKGLFTASWKPGLGLWQFDLNFALNGPGRIPAVSDIAGNPAVDTHFKAYPQLGLQVKRNFHHFQVYAGGENLTNYKQPNPIIGSHAPWSSSFEPTLTYGPVSGVLAYVGLRVNLGQHLSE